MKPIRYHKHDDLYALKDHTHGAMSISGTKADRDAIASPLTGQQFWQTDVLEGMYVYTGTFWDYQPRMHRVLLSTHFTAGLLAGGVATSGVGSISVGAAGTGANAAMDINGEAGGRHSLIRIMTGTTTSGRSSLSGGQAVTHLFRPGESKIWNETALRIPVLSDSADRFTIRVGMIDSPNADGTDGVFFRYADNVNGGKWQCVTRAAGVETAGDSNVVADTGWHDLAFRYTSSLVRFYIDGVEVVTTSTNIPSGSQLTNAYSCMIVKGGGSVGTTNRDLYIDRIFVTEL